MSEPLLAFFSSDAREKYKTDVFRALALPRKYVIHFRYQTQYVQPLLLDDLDSLKNRNGVIIYASGNDMQTPKEQRAIKFVSIRRVLVRDVSRDPNLGLVNFYLELGDFIDCSPDANTPKELLTPNLSVSEIGLVQGEHNTWQDRVDLFKNDLTNTLFYLLDSVRYKNTVLEPKYSETDRESYYALTDESEYQLHFSILDPSGGDYGIAVETSRDELDLYIPATHKVGAPRDTSVFKLHTHTLLPRSALSYSTLSIKPSSPDAKAPNLDLSVQIRWNIAKKFWNILLFALFSMLGTAGVLAASAAGTDFTKTTLTPANCNLAGAAIILVGTAAGFLYWIFNKK